MKKIDNWIDLKQLYPPLAPLIDIFLETKNARSEEDFVRALADKEILDIFAKEALERYRSFTIYAKFRDPEVRQQIEEINFYTLNRRLLEMDFPANPEDYKAFGMPINVWLYRIRRAALGLGPQDRITLPKIRRHVADAKLIPAGIHELLGLARFLKEWLPGFPHDFSEHKKKWGYHPFLYRYPAILALTSDLEWEEEDPSSGNPRYLNMRGVPILVVYPNCHLHLDLFARSWTDEKSEPCVLIRR